MPDLVGILAGALFTFAAAWSLGRAVFGRPALSFVLTLALGAIAVRELRLSDADLVRLNLRPATRGAPATRPPRAAPWRAARGRAAMQAFASR